MEEFWLNIVKEYGPIAGLIAFSIWRDFKREERLEKRITELNTFIRDQLMSTIDKNNEALNRVKQQS